MTCIFIHRVSRRASSLAAALCLFALADAHAAPAMDLDVPQIQVSAGRGSVQQEIKLGAAYFVGRGVPQNDKLAAYWYEKAANSGDPAAQKQIGFFYQSGIGVPRDPARAVSWYRLAAAGGLISAKVNLGIAYVWGIGTQKDVALGMQLLEEAVNKHDGFGAFCLGEIYHFGIGVEKDPDAAQRWYEVGAKLHDPRAQFRFGVLTLKGQPSPYERKKATEMLRESAEKGYIPAKHALGMLLTANPELAKSSSEPSALLQDAAAAGTWRSSVGLGIIARDGTGVPMDLAAAYYHFRVAAIQGGEEASRFLAHDLSTLTAKLGPERTALMDAQAAAWAQKHQLALEFVFRDGDHWSQFPAFALTRPEGDEHIGRLLPTP